MAGSTPPSVTADDTTRTRLVRNGIARYTPVHDTLDHAIAGLNQTLSWRCAVFTIPRGNTNGIRTRHCVERTCRQWAGTEHVIADAAIIATQLVDNAMRHTGGDALLRLELGWGKLVIAVHDNTSTPAPTIDARHSRPRLGLPLVERLAYSWGTAPAIPHGAVVWATLPI